MTPNPQPFYSHPSFNLSHRLHFHFFFIHHPILLSILPTFPPNHHKTTLQNPNLSLKTTARFLPPSSTLFNFDSPEASTTLQCCKQEEKKSILEPSRISNQPAVILITKSIAYTIACIAIVFTRGTSGGNFGEERESEIVLQAKVHRLLETVSSLLRVIEEVRGGNGEVERVRLALKAVRRRKEQLQDEISSGLQELGEMKREKDVLMKRGEEIVDEVLKFQWESEKVEGKETAEMLETIRRLEEDYGQVWGRVGEIKDHILRRETVAWSLGVREPCFIERKCEGLVRRFDCHFKWKGIESQQKRSATKLSKAEI